MPNASVVVHSRFDQIAREIEPKVSTAIRRGAEQIAEDAKSRVPTRTGALRNAIHVEKVDDLTYSVVGGDEKAFYGHIVEYGSINTAPRPFLIPAAEARADSVQAAIRTALNQL